jgi:hypothetical protein
MVEYNNFIILMDCVVDKHRWMELGFRNYTYHHIETVGDTVPRGCRLVRLQLGT